MPKVLLVGLDGATFDVLRPLAASGRLPYLGKMLDQGAIGTLQSTIPPVTPAAWTTLFTGKNPGKHGIYDFQTLDPATYRFHTVRTDQHREKTLWRILGEAGLRSLIIDVPFTYPPRPLEGWMITGYGTPRTPGTTITYPPDLRAHLPPDLQPEVRVALPSSKFERSQTFIEEWWDVMSGRRKLLHALIREQPWDFFMVVFSITDNMAHVFWTFLEPAHPNYRLPEAARYREAFFHAYEVCDQLLGELMAAAGAETTTLVLSDHGFGSVRPRQYIFRRLMRAGYLAPKGSSRFPFSGQVMRVAADVYQRFPWLREWVKGLRKGQRQRMKATLKRAGVMPTSQNIDFTRSIVIPTNFGLRMWVNGRARFPDGVVPPGKVDEVMDQLIAHLKADRDAVTGDPIIAEVHKGADLYHGPHADQGPDLVIEYANFFRPDAAPSGENPHLEGGHTLEGVFLAQGPDIQTTQIRGASLQDIAPTVLHLLDQPVPRDMDGQVLETLFSPVRLQEHPVRFDNTPARLPQSPAGPASGYSPHQEGEIEEQLRQLGYID